MKDYKFWDRNLNPIIMKRYTPWKPSEEEETKIKNNESNKS